MNTCDLPAYPHIPVLLQETLRGLNCAKAGLFIDGTVGCGGHAEAMLMSHAENRVIGIDRDADALEIARQRLARFGERVSLHHARHEAFEEILRERQAAQPDGILFDLGVSSLQFDTPERGFSFQQAARLDMRMDRPPDGGAGGHSPGACRGVIQEIPAGACVIFCVGHEIFSLSRAASCDPCKIGAAVTRSLDGRVLAKPLPRVKRSKARRGREMLVL